jgi:hypothetical protein
MKLPRLEITSRAIVAGVAVFLFSGLTSCASPRKVAALDESATRRSAPPPRPAPWVAPPVEKSASGTIDTGIQLDFPAPMTDRQIQDNLPSVHKQLRQAYPDLPEPQKQKLIKQAEDAMRRGGGVLLQPTLL